MILKTAIIDDESKAIGVLQNKLRQWKDLIDLVGTATSVSEGLNLLESQDVDLLLLDIQLRDGTGFTLLKQLPRYNFEVVFTTAYDSYAIQAFKVNALDYLLKPIDSQELDEAVKRAVKKKLENDGKSRDRIRDLIRGQEVNKLAIREKGKITFANIEDVNYLIADGVYTEIYLSGGKKFVTSQNLGHYEEILRDNGFMRIHRSHLINLSRMKEYLTGEHLVVMSDDKHFPVSKSMRKSLSELLKGN